MFVPARIIRKSGSSSRKKKGVFPVIMEKVASVPLRGSFLYFLTGIRGVLLFPVLMSIAASIKIPLFFTPVPITLQTLVLFLSIACLKEKAGIAQALYIALGCLGFPSFAFPAWSIFYIAGPTGGYLLGFFLAASIGGILLKQAERANTVQCALVFLLSTGIVYLCGIAWLMTSLRIPFAQALIFGAYPFAAGDLFKIAIAAPISARLMGALKNPHP